MKFHQQLNDKIWDLTTEDLIPEVKEKLEEIADTFIEFLEIPTEAVLDKVITGSSASYNYNEFSDLDLHIIVDYDKVHEDCPLVNGYLNSLKKQFNDNHDITIHGVPVELYAEQKDQGTVHNGLYSLQTGWIDRPQKIEPTDNDAAVEAKYNEIKELVDKCDDSEEAIELLEKIYTMRKAGLAEAGEFCTENLAFKKLRNEGCMDKLRQIKKEQIDKQLSLESYNETLEQDVKELTKTDDYYKVDGSRISIKNGFGSQVELMDLQNLGKKLEKKGYKVYCSNYYIDAKKNESIKEASAFDPRFANWNNKILRLKQKITDLIINGKKDSPEYDKYVQQLEDMKIKLDRLYRGVKPNKNESIKEDNNYGWKKFGKNGQILKCGDYVAKIVPQAVGNNYIATLNIKYKKQPLNMQTFEDKEEAKKWLENKLPKYESMKESENIIAKINKLIDNVNKTILDTIKNKKEAQLYTLKQNKNKDGQTVLKLYRGDREFMTSKLAGDTLLGDDIIGHLNSIKSSKYECLNKLEETLKKVKDMEINEGMWASPFTMENAKQVAELLSKPITYEELNSEEGKQKVWNIIGDDEFWDNVADEALDNPEEDARYLIVKFLEDWMERKESFNDDAYSQEAENIIKKAIFMFNGITEDMATLEKKVDTADNDLHDIITSLENTMSEALKE